MRDQFESLCQRLFGTLSGDEVLLADLAGEDS
jgi:hypothetical protein